MWRLSSVLRLDNSLIQARSRSLMSVFTKVVADFFGKDHYKLTPYHRACRFVPIDGPQSNLRNFHARTSVFFSKSIHENPRNQNIKAKSVLLIDSEGENLGTVTINEALDKAKEKSLHLVQIERQMGVNPAICKLLSPKMIFDSEKKAKTSSDGAKQKELTITGRIAPQDLKWKIQKIYNFLGNGNSVKLSIKQKPYQKISLEEKLEIAKRVVEVVKDVGVMEGEPREIGALALRCHFKPLTHKSKSREL